MFKTVKNRKYYSDDFDIFNLESVKKEFKKLLSDNFESFEDFQNWIYKKDEVGAILEEGFASSYAASTCNTEDEVAKKNVEYFQNELFPKIKPLGNEIDKKFLDSPFVNQLDDKDFEVIIRNAKNSIELFRKENIPLEQELMNLNQEYQQIMGSIMINFKGKEYTVHHFSKFFQNTTRALRKEAFELMHDRYAK